MEVFEGSQHAHNVRYQIAKGQIDQLFLKWISHSNTEKLISKLINELETGQAGSTLSAPPSPLFITKMQKQPGSPTQKGLTPPRSPSGEKYGFGRTISPKQTSNLFDSFKVTQGPTGQTFSTESGNQDPYNAQFSKTDSSALNSLARNGGLDLTDLKSAAPSSKGLGSPTSNKKAEASEHQTSPRSPIGRKDKVKKEIKKEDSKSQQKINKTKELKDPRQKEIIPIFYHAQGPILSQDELKAQQECIDKIFLSSSKFSLQEFEPVCVDYCKLPKIFKHLLFEDIKRKEKIDGDKISKDQVISYFKREFEGKSNDRRLFILLAQKDKRYLQPDDFKPLFKNLLETHPGLEFLKATPEFQDRYADTVVMRIFFMVDSNDDSKITWRDFKQSNLMKIFQQVSQESDINVVRQYFSYEHFYVLYCRFWELDTDHDFLIDKEDFSRYEGHALSRKAVDRIFEQVPRKFKSTTKDKMNYEDFVWFMLSEEDKTTMRSIQYWFKVIDLDDNRVITPHEMEYFYEEQVHRLEYLNHEPILFLDLLCQMNDLVKPSFEGHFTYEELRGVKTQIGIFFNCLVNLNKFISYETRDLFSIKHQLNEFPDYSEWDRFAKTEYERLAMEEEQGEDSEVLDAMDGWDSEEETGASGAGKEGDESGKTGN